jgi:hypothetical protein
MGTWAYLFMSLFRYSAIMTEPQPQSVHYSEELTVQTEKPTPAKAIMAGVTALAATLTVALSDNGITATEWVTIAAGTILAIAGVYAVSNAPGGVSFRR